ncbi:MAG TPA: hypothetical protein DHV62_06560 [Elusimicrobia bacterium]|nr:hypothetical protein [Elusimicrobiota bacterium]
MKKIFNPLVPPFDSVPDNLTDIATRSHTALSDIGTNTHAQIDTHIASTSNPHTTTLEQARTANNSVSGQIVSTLATGTKPFAPTSTTKCDNLNADLLDGLHDTNFTKTTAGQTINVSTAAELTTALANLAAAPSLLGNVIIQMADGTYTGNFTIPRLVNNGFTLTIQGNITVSSEQTISSATQGGGSPATTHATITQTGAGWTVDTHQAKWVYFPLTTATVALRGVLQLIETNTSDTLTLIDMLPAAPTSSDTFYFWNPAAIITSTTGDIISNYCESLNLKY